MEPHSTTWRVLVPQPGIEPVSLAVEAQSPNHWTTKEFLFLFVCLNNEAQRTQVV